MMSMMENKDRIEKREMALATAMANKKQLERELSVYREELQLAKQKNPIDMEEVRFLASEITKAQRDITSEEQYEKEKLAELRILNLKHIDFQQQYVQIQTGTNVFKFPRST